MSGFYFDQMAYRVRKAKYGVVIAALIILALILGFFILGGGTTFIQGYDVR